MQKIILTWLVAAALVLAGCSGKRVATGPTKVDNSHVTPYPSTALKGKPKELVDEARTWLGVPYRYGGHSRKGTDCSGFVMEVFQSACDMALPRSSRDMCKYARPIDRDKLMAGDLVFFVTGSSGKVSHVGLYIGDGRIIHATTSKGVIESDLSEKYWARTFHSTGRVLDMKQDVDKKPIAKSSPVRNNKTKDKPKSVPNRREQHKEKKKAAKTDNDDIYTSR